MAAVEGQEAAVRAFKARAHAHLAVGDGEMHQRPAGEGEDRLRRVAPGQLRQAVEAVLVHRVLDALGVVRLELGGGDRDAVEEQHEVEAVLVMRGVA